MTAVIDHNRYPGTFFPIHLEIFARVQLKPWCQAPTADLRKEFQLSYEIGPYRKLTLFVLTTNPGNRRTLKLRMTEFRYNMDLWIVYKFWHIFAPNRVDDSIGHEFKYSPDAVNCTCCVVI